MSLRYLGTRSAGAENFNLVATRFPKLFIAQSVNRIERRAQAPSDCFEQLATRLQLNADQKTKVQQIFGHTRQQLQALRKESEPRVNDIRQQTGSANATGADAGSVAEVSADAR